MDVTFYLAPWRVTFKAFSELLKALEEEGVACSQVTPVGFTGHVGVTGLTTGQALALLDMLERCDGKVTDIRTRMGTFKGTYGDLGFTPRRIRAYIMMNGRVSGEV